MYPHREWCILIYFGIIFTKYSKKTFHRQHLHFTARCVLTPFSKPLTSGFVAPHVDSLLLDFLVANEPDRKWQGYVIALGLFLTTSVKAIFFGHSLFGATRVGIRIKSVLVAAIYKKVHYLLICKR